MAVSRWVADELGLPFTPALGKDGKPMPLVFPKLDRPVAVHPDSIQADNCIPWVKGQVIVLDTETVRTLGSERVDGILGMNAFGACSALFDFKKQVVTLWYPSTMSAEDLKKAGMEGAIELPVEAPDMYFNTSVGVGPGKELKVLIDTGAVQTGITFAMARELGLTATAHKTKSSLIGPVKFSTATLPKLSIGPFEVENLSVEYPESDKLGIPAHLGLDVLSRFRLLIDVPNSRMFLKPVEKSARK